MEVTVFMEDLFAFVGEPIPEPEPTPEAIAGQLANKIFRPWFKQFYEGRYTQSPSHINKVLRDTILELVVNGEEDLEIIRLAMFNIGATQKPVSPLVLQYSIGEAKKEMRRRGDQGAYQGMVSKQETYRDFAVHGLPQEAYGALSTDDDDLPF